METEKVYAMPFAKIYPMLVEKAARKGRTQAEWNAVWRFLSRCSAAQSGPGAHKGQHLQRKAGEHRRTADEGDPLFGQAGG